VLWIKICGLTTAQAVHTAVDSGADAIGFVFAASKRRVSPEQAAMLAKETPRTVARVAVMQHPSQALLDEVCRTFRPDVLQTDATDLAELQIPHELTVLPVIRDQQTIESLLPPRVLYEGQVSGAGAIADWAVARSLANRTQLILAGGLNAANVAEAIGTVQPFGVDVSSGVESAPGVKDTAKIEEFIRVARATRCVPA
jgi:phosphoribosylanthranilate isomerase